MQSCGVHGAVKNCMLSMLHSNKASRVNRPVIGCANECSEQTHLHTKSSDFCRSWPEALPLYCDVLHVHFHVVTV